MFILSFILVWPITDNDYLFSDWRDEKNIGLDLYWPGLGETTFQKYNTNYTEKKSC